MNCPHCGNRNPSGAARCLHCNATLAQEESSLLDFDSPDSIWNTDKLFWSIGGVFVVIIGGSALLFGFDTYDSKCVQSPEAAAKYENSPQWQRDESAESFKRERERRRHRERTGTRLRNSRYDYLRCYKKKTGHVDGALE